jgi:hypothetical protein
VPAPLDFDGVFVRLGFRLRRQKHAKQRHAIEVQRKYDRMSSQEGVQSHQGRQKLCRA